MDNKTESELIRDVLPFYNHLTKAQQETLLYNAHTSSYEPGGCIHCSQNGCMGILIVKTGVVRAYIISDEGREITLFRMYPGEVCVLSATCVLKEITFDLYVDAAKECKIITLPSKIYSSIMSENIYMEAYTYKMAAEKFSDIMWTLQQILFTSFDKRLAAFLLDESLHTNSNNITLTHEQIAKYIGSAREVVSRMLKYFGSEGLVRIYRGGIEILNRDGLKKICT